MSLNERLRSYRIFNNLTINQLAERLNMNPIDIGNIEDGKKEICYDLLVNLSIIYNVSIDDLKNKDPRDKKEYSSKDKEFNFQFNNFNVEINKKHDSDRKIKKKNDFIKAVINACSYLLVLIAYLIISLVSKDWNLYWTLFFIPGIIDSIFECIIYKKVSRFNITFTVLFAYLFTNMYFVKIGQPVWSTPNWALFFAIPLFYIIVCPIESKWIAYKEEI